MTKRHISLLLCTAALVGSGVGAAWPTSLPKTYLVHQGESIQKAVDSAKSGDTVLLFPGVYHESVKVTTPGLTLRGMGHATVLAPPAGKATGDCGERGNGICVAGTKTKRLKDVTVSDLTLTGFPRAGLIAVGTDGLTVQHVTAANNGLWGIAEERSVRSVIRQNTAQDNGDAGVFLANTITAEQGATETQGTLISHNRLEGNRIGVTVRRLRDLTVAENNVSGNCAGVFVVGDENKPKAGNLTVRGNWVVENNKYCPKTARLPYLQGSGIVLTGAEDTRVTGNAVVGNTGKSPLSGGVVLFKSFVGVTSDRNRISDNTLDSNTPADIVNQESAKRNNTFEHNVCWASKPAGLC
ncbi:right-handed parallel beta-helix repeat-containing protein [Streptomyces sp. NPDC046197]|uniref:right-handed parallel beta-helix repeat-containing protein n=1 Tax=Streptomyces sp. NPDC046197 TaxID=3154337 RepID=UPI0033D9015D